MRLQGAFVGSERLHQPRLGIIRGQRDRIVRPEPLQQQMRGGEMLAMNQINSRASLHHQQHLCRRFHRSEMCDDLRLAFVEHAKILALQVAHVVAARVGDRHIQVHQFDAHRDSRFGLLRGGCWLLLRVRCQRRDRGGSNCDKRSRYLTWCSFP